MNRNASGSAGLLRLLSALVPGLLAGVTFPATAGLPWLNRVAIGVAVGVAIYAVIYYAVRALLGEPRGSGAPAPVEPKRPTDGDR